MKLPKTLMFHQNTVTLKKLFWGQDDKVVGTCQNTSLVSEYVGPIRICRVLRIYKVSLQSVYWFLIFCDQSVNEWVPDFIRLKISSKH